MNLTKLETLCNSRQYPVRYRLEVGLEVLWWIYKNQIVLFNKRAQTQWKINFIEHTDDIRSVVCNEFN